MQLLIILTLMTLQTMIGGGIIYAVAVWGFGADISYLVCCAVSFALSFFLAPMPNR